MKIDSRPRDFNYIYYKDTYPLELKGRMKRKPQSHSLYINYNQMSNRGNNQ
jgi:hypothetical protein